jgi:YegS/Rv2252/BmrU family lipid kinase
VKALFVVNARSGPIRGRDMAGLIRANCTLLDYEIIASERKEDLDGIVAVGLRNGVEAVIAVGGDGTVHEVAKRLIGTQLALGIIPTGSGNGFAHHHHIPTNARAAVRMLPSAKRVVIDTAEVNGVPFIGVMGIGYAALIAHRFAELPQRGFRSYVRAALSAFLNYQPEEYEVSADTGALAGTQKRRAFLIEIANTAHWGNNFRIAPEASVLDGMLDVVIVDPMSFFEGPLFSLRLRLGTVHRSRRVTTIRATEVVIRVLPASAGRIAGATRIHLDGEPLTMEGELKIRVRPQSLTVLVPPDAVMI